MMWLTPRNISEIEENNLSIGDATDRIGKAKDLVERNRRRISEVEQAVRDPKTRHVVFLEWIDPFFCAGHWVPEVIASAAEYHPLRHSGAGSWLMYSVAR